MGVLFFDILFFNQQNRDISFSLLVDFSAKFIFLKRPVF
jgi:hypothetical protein